MNNHLEGWHHKFQTVVAKHHSNVFEFIDRLREEQAHTETRVQQLVAGAAPTNIQEKVCYLINQIHRGAYMSAHVLLNLLNELGKIDKMRGLPSILSLFSQRV